MYFLNTFFIICYEILARRINTLFVSCIVLNIYIYFTFIKNTCFNGIHWCVVLAITYIYIYTWKLIKMDTTK